MELEQMQIAVTVNNFCQVSVDEWRNMPRTKVFKSSASIHEIMEWARTVSKNVEFAMLDFSVVSN